MIEPGQTVEPDRIMAVPGNARLSHRASTRSALYFRVSSNRQTTENQFDDLLQIGEAEDTSRDWDRIRDLLGKVVEEEHRPTHSGGIRIVYRVNPGIAQQLADAAQRKFERLLVWKASRLGRDMREVIATVYELSDLGITVNPVKSQTRPISSTMGKLLWSIQAWFAEMENDERSEAIKAGHVRARSEGKAIGRPRLVFRRDEVVRLRDQEGYSWGRIKRELKISTGTARRAYLSVMKEERPHQIHSAGGVSQQ